MLLGQVWVFYSQQLGWELYVLPDQLLLGIQCDCDLVCVCDVKGLIASYWGVKCEWNLVPATGIRLIWVR